MRIPAKLRPGGDARADWRTINDLIAALDETAKRLAVVEAKPDRKPGVGGMRWCGLYDSTRAYSVGDVVAVIGTAQSTYVCQVAHAGSAEDDAHAPWLGEYTGSPPQQYWGTAVTSESRWT